MVKQAKWLMVGQLGDTSESLMRAVRYLEGAEMF